MSNSFSVYSSKEGMTDFLKSSISSSNKIIEHYDFVIKDISSEITDPVLESSKKPVLDFLNAMKTNWIVFHDDLEEKLKQLQK